MSDSKSSAEWQEEANRLNYVILDGRRERDELKAQLEESERKRDIAYSALATDEAERKRLAGLCDQLSFQLEQERASAEQLRQAAETNHAAAQHNCKMAEEWERQAQELQAQLDAMRLERDGWKAGAEAGQQQATQLRLQVDSLESTMKNMHKTNKTIAGQLADADAQIRQLEQVNDTRDELQHRNKQLQAQLEAATPDGSRSWQCELTEAQNRLEAALEQLAEEKKGHKRCDEDFRSERAVRLELEARLSSYHKHEQELRDILGWARSYQRCGLTIQPSRLVQLMQKITLHDGTAKLFFEEEK